MDNLPIDTSHPEVRDYLSLIRLQVITPLSLLINIATVCICAVVTKPTIGQVIMEKPTALSPNPSVLAAYIGVLFIGQIGYCILLVMASKRETKSALIKGVGMSLVMANFGMALWAICWVMQWFLIASILQGILLLLLLYSNIALYIYHPVTSARPLDALFIHAPLRFFMVLTMMLLFPYCLYVTLHLIRDPKATEPWHAWAAFGVVLGTNLLSLVVIFTLGDIVWCAAATWIAVSLWSQSPKPVPVFVTAVAFTAIHPVALISSMAFSYYTRRHARQGRIALPRDDEHPGLHGRRRGVRPTENTAVEEGSSPSDARTDDVATTIWG